MSNKNFTYLLLITILLFVLASISFLIQPKYETSIEKGEIIFSKAKEQINNINEIIIDDGKNKISISQNQNNWSMNSKSGYKVKNEVVRKNLIQISELRFSEKKTKEEFLYSRLDLDYPNDEDGKSKLISINNNNNENILEFVLGKRKKGGVYIKKLNEKQTWLTSGTLDMSSIENDWLETKILEIEYNLINKISVNHLKKEDSFSLTKDDKGENLLIDNLNKDQLPKSDLIANFFGYFLTNLVFNDVEKRKIPNDIDIITKINFTFIDDSKLTAIIFNSGKEKWINFIRDDATLAEGKTFYVDNLNDWSYKLSSTKYNVTETKLKDLLVEE